MNTTNKIFCLICGVTVYGRFGTHLRLEHNITRKEYYDQYLKQSGDGMCKHCKINPTNWSKIKNKYSDFCSPKCSTNNETTKESIKNTLLKKYGTTNYFEIDEIRQKKENTCLKRYGVKNPSQNEEIKLKKEKIMLERYGCTNPLQYKDFKEKTKQTCLEKYGVDNPAKNEIVKQKMEKTNLLKYGHKSTRQNKNVQKTYEENMLKKYGVTNTMHVKEFYDNCKEKSLTRKIYILPSKQEIKVLGYEPQFLDYVLQNNILNENEIQYESLKIPYIMNNKKHIYHPDFYIPKWNLVVEIKGSNWYKRDKNIILLKEQATIQNGYNYIIIIDNDFKDFEFYIKNLR